MLKMKKRTVKLMPMSKYRREVDGWWATQSRSVIE